jgi:DNA-directed RNA polymerase subunit omega
MDNSADSIKERIPNRYSLVVLAAKRAKQLKEGAPLLIETESTNLLTIALEEIAAGKINFIAGLENEDGEAPVAIAPIIPSAPPTPEAQALQRLTQSLAEAEREASDLNEAEDDDEAESAEDVDDAEPALAIAGAEAQ